MSQPTNGTPNGIYSRRNLLTIVAICVLGALVIQLIPLDRTNPPVVREPNWDSPQTRALAVRACFDCHSNETRWPWYSYVAPLSWWVYHDVREGRERLNFSAWGTGRFGVNDIQREIRRGTMPPSTYRIAHPDANLTDAEKNALIQGLERTIGQS